MLASGSDDNSIKVWNTTSGIWTNLAANACD
ncbi:hypothetical protein [Tolypothrix bouteillei]